MLLHLVTVVLALLVAYGGESTQPPPAEPGDTRLTRDEVYAIALQVSGDEVWASEATAVAYCESRFRVDAVGDQGRAFGLMQVHGALHGSVPGTARGQIAQAYVLWLRSGWKPWSCSPRRRKR